MALMRTKAGWRGAARIAVSNSASEQLWALGQFGATILYGYTRFNEGTSQIFDDDCRKIFVTRSMTALPETFILALAQQLFGDH